MFATFSANSKIMNTIKMEKKFDLVRSSTSAISYHKYRRGFKFY